ncbi:MAG: TPM domain-containing protein [Melioribacteraceae bacterium]|nr:TPM domain-containing protein [Melioribacteraceae bacterium]MCF8266003.1 TPM domain-containing protein [Melioribacteraceae bacterium]MCF8414153.1 TPM domain-containing protein [Melioribacteraceae bacterium]
MKKLIPIIFFFFSLINAQVNPPQLSKYATDLTSTLSSREVEVLNQDLAMFYDTTSTQVVFLMIPELEDYPIEMFANETAEKNKIGTKGNDNGVLFLVSKNDRKMRIEVGYGLEGALPDALASSILRNEVGPNFKRGDYFRGIASGVIAIKAATQGEYSRESTRKKRDKDGGGGIGSFIYLILFILVMIFSRRGRGGGGGGLGTAILLGSILGSGGRSSGGGFGGGSGGFGGFSGGGGGFGGGGASGSW